MKKELMLTIILLISTISFASATISLNQQPDSVYNLGDLLEIPISIIADAPINNLLSVKMDCGVLETEIYKEYISMENGEKERDLSIPLVPEFIGNSTGECAINYQLGTETGSLTGVFSISNKIILTIDEKNQSFSPGEKVILSGSAIKENGVPVEGVIEATISLENFGGMIYSNAINEGKFNLEINLPKDTPAGTITINLNAYEKNKEGISLNNGQSTTTIKVRQIPTNLEIVLEESSANPGEKITGEILVHDQTGKVMDSKGYISIKNEAGEIIKKFPVATGEKFEYEINESQKPAIWKITAYSNELTTLANFKVNEYKKVDSKITENILEVKNTGNVPYSDVLDIKIGNATKQIELNLEVGETKKFTLSAPSGEYVVKVGDETHKTVLTGKAIDVKEFSNKAFSLNPLIWIFVILILGMMALMIFRKGYKKAFFGRRYKHSKEKPDNDEMIAPSLGKQSTRKRKSEIINPSFPAELSISLHGTKQTSDIVSINLKNNRELTGEGGVSETLQKIVDFAEENRALTYFTKDNLFFLLVPTKTKTFKNEIRALSIAKEAERILKHHNKLYKQKIEFGIAIDSGDLIIHDGNPVKFMAMTSIMTNIKKISHYSEQEIYLSEIIRGRLGSSIKTERKEMGSKTFHKLKTIVQKADNSKFIKGFLERLEKDKELMRKIKNSGNKE